MPVTITMPALSPTMEEGTLAKWHVKPGDAVKAGQIIAEIETDKATMDLEAVDEGVIGRLLVEEGAAGVKVNAPIAEMKGDGEAAPKTTGTKASDASPPPRSGGGGSARSAETEGAVAKASSVVAAPGLLPARETQSHAPTPVVTAPGARIKASPLARRLASAKGVDLSALKGSGPHGRIIKIDIDKAQPGGAKASAAPAGAGITSLIEPAVLDDRVYAPDSYDLIPLDGVRRVTARRLTQSFMQVPHFPLEIDLAIDHLLAARKAINEALGDKGKISVNDMLIKAAALALIAQPDANASFTDKGIARHKSAHVSMAVAIEGGLITPVIRDAQTKGLREIATETKDLAARARDRKLRPQEYMGGTFSISNLGMFGIRSFGSILNPPEGMILSVGEGAPRAIVKDGKIEIATILSVTLTCDHRVVDGATGAKWLQHFRQFVETPESMLL